MLTNPPLVGAFSVIVKTDGSFAALIWAFKQEQDKRSFNLCMAVRGLRGAGPLPAAGVAHMKVPSVLTISIYFMVKFAHCVFCYSFATTTFRAKSELCHGI